MQKFNNSSELIRAIKNDLLNKTYPSFLTSITTVTESKLRIALAKVAKRANDRSPELKTVITTIPSPGSAAVSTAFLASSMSVGDIKRSLDTADGYKVAFKRVHEDNLGSKNKLIKLLNSIGVQ